MVTGIMDATSPTDMAQLIEPLIPALRRYARALLRDRVAADDLVQDCLERAVAHWRQRRTDGDARSWIFAILHNLAATQLKRQTAQAKHVDLESVENWLPVPPSQEDGLRYHALLRGLAQLPEDQRAVLLLVGVEDLSYADTAKVLAIPIGTVMSRLSRARERLLRMMTEGEIDQPDRPHLRRIK
jgi:RNA polymerase sigma-70 factor (ECF subfamily)